MKQSARRACLALAGIFIGIGCTLGKKAETQTTRPPAASAAPVAKISAQTQNSVYRIEWDGKNGSFTRKGMGTEPDSKMPLVYLQTDPGPNGYAKHLAWFLARDKNQFALIWCYLDDNGHTFWCWLYRYPTNELVTLPFVGDYQYGPPPAGDRPSIADNFLSGTPPTYTGTDFVYKDWTRQSGKLDSLTLGTALANGQTLTLDTNKGTKPLTGLKVTPLHEIQVGQGNGWRPGGWQELHALAFDSANDPYYLILYSNTNIGYALDLKHAQPYVADFTERVRFGGETTGFGPNGKVSEEIDTPRVVRYNRYEITLNLTRKEPHPYTEVNLDAELHAPSGKVMRVPGFWDGGGVFHVRFVPTAVGRWTWRILANDNALNGKTGRFDCVAEIGVERGFLHITPTRSNQRYFVTAASKPIYPVIATGAVSQDWYPATNRPTQLQTAGLLAPQKNPDAQFAAFQKRIDNLAVLGFNRIYGDFLLLPPNTHGIVANNEGGEPFIGGNPDELNPAFFQAMDKRLSYCNAKGIVPNLGIGIDATALYARYSDLQMRRLWRYVLGRYASYEICWDLFGSAWWDNQVPPPSLDPHIASLASLTTLYDPNHHPLTTLTRFVQTATGGSSAPWADVLTVPVHDTALLDSLYSFDKPIIAVDTPGLSDPAPQIPIPVLPLAPPAPGKEGLKPDGAAAAPSNPADSVRYRLWESRMHGAYWASARPLDEQEMHWVTNSATFFQKTRYWRLEPHQEMLGGPEETPAARRRRKEAEEEARKKNPNAPPPSENAGPAVPNGPIFVLADPPHEYVIYFEKGGAVTLDLLEATGRIKVLWFNPRSGESLEEGGAFGGSYRTFVAPDTNDWVLYIARH